MYKVIWSLKKDNNKGTVKPSDFSCSLREFINDCIKKKTIFSETVFKCECLIIKLGNLASLPFTVLSSTCMQILCNLLCSGFHFKANALILFKITLVILYNKYTVNSMLGSMRMHDDGLENVLRKHISVSNFQIVVVINSD